MTVILMNSPKYRVLNLINKTQAARFKDIKPGDILYFSTPLISRYSYKHIVKTIVLSEDGSKMIIEKTFNQLEKIIGNFKLEEIHELDLKESEK